VNDVSVVSRPRPELGVEREAAIGSFLWGGRARILSVLPLLRRPGSTLECHFQGGSMRPAIPARSRLRIDTAAHDACNVGSVVAYLAGETVMVHRVVYRGRSRRARGHLIMCGDRLVIPDPPVERSWILGPVVGIQKEGHWFSPGPPYRRLPARVTAAVLAALVGALLEVDVRLARGVVRGLDWVRTLLLPIQPRNTDPRLGGPPLSA
jgi:hypothetical protein